MTISFVKLIHRVVTKAIRQIDCYGFNIRRWHYDMISEIVWWGKHEFV